MNDSKIKERFQYWFDQSMTRGTYSLIIWLGLISIIIILLTAIIVWIVGIGTQTNLVEQVWEFLMLMLEPDAITYGHWAFRIATLIIVFTSIFVLSSLIGIITTSIDIKLQELRKGKSKVLETNHTVILGWSPQIFQIISELVIANENQFRPSIVILADKDKVQMEDDIGDTRNTRVICRRGSPMQMKDLDRVNLNASKSIIILAPDTDNPDVAVIKSLLAVTMNANRKDGPYHIIAEIHDDANYDIAQVIAGDELELVNPVNLISRIAAQACRQSGLSIVYHELLDFAGDEIYVQEEEALIGKTYRESLFMYGDSSVIGIKPNMSSSVINPAMDTVILQGDQIVAISEDDDTLIIASSQEQYINDECISLKNSKEILPENTLIIGWNNIAWMIVSELDHYVSHGSKVDLLTKYVDEPGEYNDICNKLSNITCSYMQGDSTNRAVLESLHLGNYDHVIILSYSDCSSNQESDAITLITLLHLRDLADIHGYSFSIVSELLDIQNQELAETAKSDDFIVSDRLISLVLSQISENKDLSGVFRDIFDPEGSEVYLKAIDDYISVDKSCTYATLVEAASRKNETAIGYRINRLAYSHEASFGVVINPDKSKELHFDREDKLIVLAES